jgi:amino acid adenylation domain-containing protein
MKEDQPIEMRLAANQFIDEKKYWHAELSGELEFSSFPGEIDMKDKTAGRAVLPFRIEGELYERLNRMSGGAEPNLHIILTAGIIALLERYTGTREIIIGTTIDRQESAGKLSNTVLPLRVRLSESITFKQLIIKVKEKMEQALENQDYPIEHLVYQDLRMKKPAEGFPLFDVGVMLLNLQEKKYIQHLQLNMLFSFFETDGNLECEIDFKSSNYKRETIERIFTHFTRFLASAAFNVDREIAEAEILTEAEKHLLLREFNQTQRQYPGNQTLHGLFEEQAASGPDRTAIIYRHEHYSYKTVDEQANRLARELKSRGIGADQPVGILLDRIPLMVEGILSVWKAGGAYIPMDTQYPFQRLQDMVSNSETKAILTLEKHITPPLQKAYGDIIIKLDQYKEKTAGQSPDNLNIEIDMKSLAYIIYTSGSTGKPKGAMVEHRGMLNHIDAKIEALNVTGKSILVQNASHTFDISVWQFFTALTRGGRTVIFPVEHIFDVGMFINRVVTHQITILEVVPSYLAAMMDSSDMETVGFKSLEYLLVTGETVPASLVKRWFERCPGIKMVNAYGPTEASDDITHYIMEKAPAGERIPIGKPIPNLKIYIVNRRMQPCPIGVKGEICVSGVGVGRGYINDDERTGPVFTTDPFARQEGIRLYKTGDIGSWRPDGNIDFFGRKDSQVKIRGFRIELAEIENILERYPGIQQTAVVDKTYKDGNKYLCAYFTADRGVDVTEMKAYLAERLPYYMIPAHFSVMKELPLTPNGKIHREALQKLELDREAPMELVSEADLRAFAADILAPSPIPGPTGEGGSAGEEPDRDHGENGETMALTPGERKQILEVFNNTATDYPKHKTIHRVFEEQVEKTPERAALTFEDKQITYWELNRRSNRLAGEMRTRGVKPGKIVGLMVERSLEMLTGIWAVLKAGAAYLPVGDENPPGRIKFMLEDSSVEMILGDPRESAPGYKGKYLEINRETDVDEDGDATNLEPIGTPSDLVYVIYTSGTTGTPKGVMIENRSLINFIKGMTEIIRYDEATIILSLITLSFDIVALETILPLTRGYRVVIGNKKAQAEAAVTGKLLRKENITTFQCTPTMLQRIVTDEEAAAGMQRLENLLVGGEVFREALLEKVRPKTKAKIFNLYGPTETTVWSTAKQVAGSDTLNIGKPTANTRVYILNRRDELCPIGVSGELCIGGDGVARGYLNRPGLTAEKFDHDEKTNKKLLRGVPDASRGGFLEKSPVKHLARRRQIIYRTGDLARWLENGEIEFQGRQDHQIKINGIRIELAEIENILVQYPGIDEAVVVSNEKSPGDLVLCGYLVSKKRHRESEIRSYLSGILPSYMIPVQLVQLEKIPLTPSGKIDRKLLASVKINTNESYAAPTNEIERKIKKIWETNLGIETIGIKDNFFSIGGDSIKSIGLVNRLNREFDVNLKIRDLFQNETIEKLAEKVRKPVEAPPGTGQYDQAMLELEAVKNEFMKRRRH